MTVDQLQLHFAAVKRRRRAAARFAQVLAGGWGRSAQQEARRLTLYPVLTPLTGIIPIVTGAGGASANWVSISRAGATVTPRSHSPAEGEAGAMSDAARPPLPDARVDEVLAEVRDELRQRRQDLPCQSPPPSTPATSSNTATRAA